jgi:putative radical SAM enzyme (TIGR03279 family)
MSVRIKHIAGETGFFREGDDIVAIDEMPVEDQLDLIFHLPDDGSALFTIRRKDGRLVSRSLTTATFDRAGLTFDEMRFEQCHSRCPFCFVDQMPPGLRPALYEKDDDYRLSFLFGNFITLNDVKDEEIERITDLHLSPLYISVHAVDAGTRSRLFGRPMRRNIIDVIATLAENDITMHMQIVLVPGINDGPVLDETVRELFRYYPACRSLAVVPVGLTAHRSGLSVLAGVSAGEAVELIRWAEKSRERIKRETGGEQFLHLADEFYLMADEELPAEEEYDGFPQISNGVGMCRMFISEVLKDIERLASASNETVTMAVVSGTLGARFLKRYVLSVVHERAPRIHIEPIVVENRLFGETVGVSGLIAGHDIIDAIGKSGTIADCIVIPPNAVNHDGLLIDDMRPKDIEEAIGVPVRVPETTFLESGIVRACMEGSK